MNNNKNKLIILVSYFVFFVWIALSIDSKEITDSFKFNKQYNIWSSNLIWWFSIYVIIINNLLNLKKEEVSWNNIIKTILVSLLFIVFSEPHLKYETIFIVANFLILIKVRKKFKSIIFTFILLLILGLSSYFYTKFDNVQYYQSCQINAVEENKIYQCVEKFSYHNHSNYTTYLTYINQQLAKKNNKIMDYIEKKIIDQNEDENCKINNKYEVLDRISHKGIPCRG